MPSVTGMNGASPTMKNAAASPAMGRSFSRDVRDAPRRHTPTPTTAVSGAERGGLAGQEAFGDVHVSSSAAASPTTNVTGGGNGAGRVDRVPRRMRCASRLGAADRRDRRLGRATALDQLRRDPPDAAAAGEDHERPAERGELVPVGRLRVLVVVVAVDERGGDAVLAQHQRDPGRSGRRECRRHAGDDLHGDPRVLERERLLAAARSHERVAALEPDDVAFSAELDEQVVDFRLGERALAALRARRTCVSASSGASATIAAIDGRS